LTFIDLFAGIGGFRIALENFGARCMFSSEWDKHAQQVYFDNFGEMPAGDITKIEAKEIPPHDILCGGFPCQPFSVSGKQRGFEDIRGTLFFEMVRVINFHQPKILFLENVRNFTTHDDGKTLRVVQETLQQLGYTVFYQVLNASNFGLPQNRARVYIVGFRNDLLIANFVFPTATQTSISLQEITLTDAETKPYRIKRNDVIFNNKAIIKAQSLIDFPQKPLRIGCVNKGGQGERIYHPQGHAITLSAYGGGVGAKTGLYLINKKLRKLAPRECARLQGFPDSFVLHKSNNQAYKQLGNSVPINVLKAILSNIDTTLSTIEFT
jgi:DNA (cytosine-5)-methyltransferase 1